MKKRLKILCTTILMGCLMALPAQAAETRAEYKEEVAPIRTELKEVSENLKSLREENKASAAAYKAIRTAKKETGTLSVDKDVWKEAKELHSQIVSIRKEMGESTAKTLREEAKAAVKEKDFDTALASMKQVLEIKKERLESVEQIHTLWQQIDALLAQ